jgi:hypothetical protein
VYKGPVWKSVREFPRALVNALAWIAGVAAASVPKRWWPMMDPYVPVTESASIAAILTLLVAGAIGVPGFIDHTQQQVSLNNRAVLAEAQKAAARPEADETLSQRDWGRMFVGVSSLSLFTFIFLTPAGWASTYLGISGTWRAIAAAVGDPFGDPILTGVDSLLLRGARRTRAAAARQQREMLEGPEVPDRVVRGSHIGIAGAELVIISARRKPSWDAGTVVNTGEGWYRVTSIQERTIGGWLRTLYALSRHEDHEAFRRCVRYKMPSYLERRTGDDGNGIVA